MPAPADEGLLEDAVGDEASSMVPLRSAVDESHMVHVFVLESLLMPEIPSGRALDAYYFPYSKAVSSSLVSVS